MTVSPEAQVPNTDNDPTTAPFAIGPSPAQEPLLHTGTSLEQAVEDRVIKGMNKDGTIRIPNHVPRGLIENPDAGGAREVVPVDKKKGWVKPVAIGATILTALGVGGYALFGRSSSESDSPKGGAGSDRSTSAPELAGSNPDVAKKEKPTLDNSTPEEFRSDEDFTDPERVAWAWDKLNQPTSEPGYEGMTRLAAANTKLMKANPLADGIIEPSLSMTGDQILGNEQSIYYLAAITGELSDNDRVKVLAAAIDNSNPVFDTVAHNVLEKDLYNLGAVSQVDTSTINKLPVESPIFRHTVLNNGFNPGGIETKVMNVHLKNTDFEESKQKYYQFIDGKPIQLQQVDSRDKAKRASNPQDIPAY